MYKSFEISQLKSVYYGEGYLNSFWLSLLHHYERITYAVTAHKFFEVSQGHGQGHTA